MTRGFRSFALSLMVLVGTADGQVPTGPNEVRAAILKAAEAVAREQGVLAAPGVIEEMTASAVLFVSNFCYPPTSVEGQSRCRRTVGDPAVMQSIVRAFLSDAAVNRPANIEVLGSRMARAVQTNFAMAGWPSHTDNTLSVVDISTAPLGAAIELRTASGPVRIGAAGRVVVIGAGRWELLARNSDGSASAIVQTRARAQAVAALGIHAVAPTPSTVVGSIEATPELYCYSSASTIPASGPLQVFNWGRALFVESDQARASNLAPFAKQAVLDIRVDDETHQCGGDCMAGLGIGFARAVAVWRAGCSRCNANALTVVRVGPSTWLDARIVRRMRKLMEGASGISLDLASPVAGERDATLAAPAVGVLQTTIVGYEEVSGDKALTRALCALDLGRAHWIPGAQRMLCDAPHAGDAGAKPLLRLRSAGTSCGRADEFIACGRPNEQVELALGEYRYMIQSPRGPVYIGRNHGQPIDVARVVLHEVGHWFGVPHADIVGKEAMMDVMSAVLEDGKPCVSAQSMIMMNNASDLRWPHRITSGGGLRLKRPSMSR